MLGRSLGGRRTMSVALGWVAVALLAGVSLATPTGLNNIPTADVVPQNVLVLQSWANFGSDLDTSWAAGFKYGPACNWEVGLDGGLTGPGSGQGITGQAKYRIPLQNGARVALGVANISNDTDVNGDYFPYVVLSAPLGQKTAGHAGYEFQNNNEGVFLGLDSYVGKVDVRTDWVEKGVGDDSMWSLGFITEVAPKFLFEAWATVPSATGQNTFYTAKVDYVINFR